LSIERVRWLLGGIAAALLLALIVVPAARADFATLYGGDVPCAVQAANGNVRLCSGKTTTWDGVTKIDLNVVLPPQPSAGEDGPYPVIGLFHGWGGEKIGLEDKRVRQWAEDGYAVFSMSDRGWGKSCSKEDPDLLLDPTACAQGYNHLMDDRYEVRDAQYLISVLADEGVAQPKKIGATGVSYGGGMSMALATLRNRTMLPGGKLVPWESPKGKAMELAAAVPQWPWTDLAYSLMPNGSTLDFVTDSPYKGPDGKARIGIEKASFVSGLYGTGLAESNYSLTDKEADLNGWYALINSGEPYESKPMAQEILDQITTYHSSYYIDHSQPPAPLLIQNGWNDDLFPVDEAVRYYNRTRAQYPGDPISLFLMDDGHDRSQNKAADEALFLQRMNAWFDHYLKGEGAAPTSSAEALTTTCPESAASEGPYKAADWQSLSPGEIQLDGVAAQTVVPGAGDPNIGKTFDPIAGKDPCATAAGADQAGTANYRLPVPAPGFTLLGSPTIVADLGTTNVDSELAARLLDVLPNGQERLVARGLLRPGNGGSGVVFQLHPQGYRFAGGDTAKLELLPSDAPYARPSNLQAPITVSNLRLRLPVLEQPGSLGGLVGAPSDPRVGPSSGGGAAEPISAGVKFGTAFLVRRLFAERNSVTLRLRCRGGDCNGRVRLAAKKRKLATGSYSIRDGKTPKLRLRLTPTGRKLIAAHRRAGYRPLPVKVQLRDAGEPTPQTLSRRLRLRH
jgi:dienelactone hydrolase